MAGDKTAKAKVLPVRQRSQYTCMATSLSMCLKALGIETNEDEVNRVMGARPMKGARWEEAFAAAQHFGARATLVTPCTVQALKEWTDAGTPVMISWNPEKRDWSHASVVFDITEDNGTLMVHVADPNIPNPSETVRVISEDEFYGKWAESWDNYMVRRVAMAVEREITPEGRQVQASAGRWKRMSKGGQKYVTDEILCQVLPEDTWETVRDRNVPDLYEVADPELLADGIPELEKMYQNAEKDHAKWVRQGWWPKPVKVQKWKVWIMHRPTTKAFESGYFKSEREALKMAEQAIPKLIQRKRPGWLKPASQENTMDKESRRRGKKPQKVNAPKDPKEKMRIKLTPGKQRNEDAKFLAENRGFGNPGAHKNKGKRNEGPMRKRKHKKNWDREGGAEENRLSVYSPEKGDGLTQPLSTRPDYGSEESFMMDVNDMKNALTQTTESALPEALETAEFQARLASRDRDDLADLIVEALRKLRVKARKKGKSVSVNGVEFFKQGLVLDGGLQHPNHLSVKIPWNRSVSEYDAMVEWASKAAVEIAKYLKKNKLASTKTADGAEKLFKKPYQSVEKEVAPDKIVDMDDEVEKQTKTRIKTDEVNEGKQASDLERLLTAALEVKKLQGKGLYGYNVGTQRTVEATIRKATRRANSIAKALYKKDPRTASFLGTHAKRTKSASARILVACMKNLGPKFAAETEKTAGLGMYGMNSKTAKLALAACTDVTESMGQIAYDLHARKASRHERITGFLGAHSKSARCLYAKMLLASYPEAATILTAEDKTADKCDKLPPALQENCKNGPPGAKSKKKDDKKDSKKDDGKMPPELLEKFKSKKKAADRTWADFNTALSKLMKGLKRDVGATKIKQNGSSSAGGNRNIWVKLPNRGNVDVWLEDGETQLFKLLRGGESGRGPVIPYGKQTPEQVYKKMVAGLKDIDKKAEMRKKAADEEAEDSKEAKFEKGKPADPTENMTEEQKKKWMEHHGQIGNKKKATAELVALAQEILKDAGCENLPNEAMQEACEKKKEEAKDSKDSDDEKEGGKKNARTRLTDRRKAANSGLPEGSDEEPKSGFPGVEESEENQPDMSQHGYDPGQTKNANIKLLAAEISKLILQAGEEEEASSSMPGDEESDAAQPDMKGKGYETGEVEDSVHENGKHVDKGGYKPGEVKSATVRVVELDEGDLMWLED